MLLPSSGTMTVLEILLNTIINKYLISSYCITFVSEIPFALNSPIPFTYLIPYIENLTEQLLEVSEMGCSDYVVHMRDPQKFMIAFEKVNRLGNIRRSDRKIIILPSSDDRFFNETFASHIFEMKESRSVTNILLVVNSRESSDCLRYNLISHKFSGFDTEINNLLHLDTWNSCEEIFEKGVNLFPHDLSNLHGKTIKVACFTYKPYVLLDIDPAVESSGATGVDIKLVEEFCRWVNCNVELVREDQDLWGEVYDNGTGIGVLGSVVEDRADFAITALYSWYEEYKFMDFSTPYLRSVVTCIAPAPRLLSNWETPLMPFTWLMWCAVIVTFIYASVGLTVAHGCSTDRILLTVFGMMIGQSQSDSRVSWKVRSVTGWLTNAGLLLGCAYGAGLAATFTVPRYEPSTDSMKDMVDRKMEWGALHDAWIFSLTMSNEPLIKELVSQFRILPGDELMRRSFTRSMAFSIEKLPAGTFAIGEYITTEAVLDLMIMLENFYYEHCVVMMRKSCPYTEKMSELIGRLHQSGLLLAWETQVALKHLDYKVQLEVKLSRTKVDVGNTSALNLQNVMGIFFLYMVGTVMSCLIFVVEVIYNGYQNKSITV